jgi:outer membrane protein
MKLKFFVTGLFVIVLSNSIVLADPSGKIVYVDLQKALEMTKSGQKVQKEFKGEVDSEQKNIDKKKAEYESLKEGLDKQKTSLNESALREKEDSLISLEKELKRSFQDSQEKLRRKNATLVGDLIKKMRELIEKMGKEEGYQMVLERSSQGLVYADPSLDITEEVVKKFDSLN